MFKYIVRKWKHFRYWATYQRMLADFAGLCPAQQEMTRTLFLDPDYWYKRKLKELYDGD